ncbi:hypothetical protein GJ496_011547 [Pomphorhynchus laevis]|nr:hypothetical protein GJ496_011547 [Pomphorhynchus laevis]
METDPHSAYFGLVLSLQWKLTYLLRTTHCKKEQLQGLWEAVVGLLLPTLTRQHLDKDIIALLSMPFSLGGVGIIDPTYIHDIEFECSRTVSDSYSMNLQGEALWNKQNQRKKTSSNRRQSTYRAKLKSIIQSLSDTTKLAREHATMSGVAAPAASHLIKRIATLKAEQGRRTYSEEIRKMRIKIAFELARATSARIRAPRSTRGSPI